MRVFHCMASNSQMRQLTVDTDLIYNFCWPYYGTQHDNFEGYYLLPFLHLNALSIRCQLAIRVFTFLFRLKLFQIKRTQRLSVFLYLQCIEAMKEHVPGFQWLTVFSQLVSRLCHAHKEVTMLLQVMMIQPTCLFVWLLGILVIKKRKIVVAQFERSHFIIRSFNILSDSNGVEENRFFSTLVRFIISLKWPYNLKCIFPVGLFTQFKNYELKAFHFPVCHYHIGLVAYTALV